MVSISPIAAAASYAHLNMSIPHMADLEGRDLVA